MTFLHKLAQRLARIWPLGIVGVCAVLSCDLPAARSTGPASNAVTKVIVSPKLLALLTNQSADFVAFGLSAAGDTVPVSLSWSTTGGTVTETGVVSGKHVGRYQSPQQAGQYKIVARGKFASGGDSALVTVSYPPPRQVTDLAVVSVTDVSVTLAFTEVDNGKGQPASYDVRYSVVTMSWGSAVIVQQGTCATPVAGTTIGARHTCTVLALTPATTYQFQEVAFRGTP